MSIAAHKNKRSDVSGQRAKASGCQEGAPTLCEAAQHNDTQVSSATSRSSFPAQHLTLGSLEPQFINQPKLHATAAIVFLRYKLVPGNEGAVQTY